MGSSRCAATQEIGVLHGTARQPWKRLAGDGPIALIWHKARALAVPWRQVLDSSYNLWLRSANVAPRRRPGESRSPGVTT